jgi:HK97 family phage prohead protease
MSEILALAPAGELRFRTAEQIGVSFPKRTIELIVMPYEQEALVPHPDKSGRMVYEVISRGAFDGIERRANRVRVNRDHYHPDTTVVGRAVAFHPSRQEGLVSEVRIAKTPLGDETLQLADEECLDASAGYLPMAGGEKWESRKRFRVSRAWLGHIALVSEPAHEGARVLAVRGKQEGELEAVATPNLAAFELKRLQDAYAAIDARYSVS